jgi:hypothetical protein
MFINGSVRFLALLFAPLLIVCLHPAAASAGTVSGAKRVIILRVYFHDYSNTSHFTQTQVQGFFNNINTLWGTNSSYGNISISAQVSALYQIPGNRSDYIDTPPDIGGDLSSGTKFQKVLDDSVAAAPSGLDWTNIAAVMVVMAETDTTKFHRGQGGKCNVAMGPGSSNKPVVGCAIFSENPGSTDAQVWGRWAHELGHAFQSGGPAHPSDYNSSFEQMDANYPGQTGVFEKQTSIAFGWMPDSKYQIVTPTSGGRQATIYTEEQSPASRPNIQAVKAYIGGPGSAYYLVSVRRKILGDDLNAFFSPAGIPDEGVLIERVTENSDPWVTIQGKGGDRDVLWHDGDLFQNTSDGIFISVKKVDTDDYAISVRYADQSNRPDIGINSWLQPPSNTYETTDLWVDSPVNGYGTFRYGTWPDLMGGTVPKGNGDDPAIGQINRIYARIRNYGVAPASNVVVHFDVTNPPGLGINGSNGFQQIGTVTSAQFPGLASIAPGISTDVYIEWTPTATLTPEQIAEGTFYFHTCMRVRLDHVPNETIFGNQDGDGQQENIDYFQAPAAGDPGAQAPHKNRTIVHLHNDDLTHSKFFNLGYDTSTVPAGWKVVVNGGILGIELAPNERRDFPVDVLAETRMPAGKSASIKVFASSLRLLVNDKNPKDLHPEYKQLGGVQVEGHAVITTKIKCEAIHRGEIVEFVGSLESHGKFNPRETPVVFMEGVGPEHQFLPRQSTTAHVDEAGRFKGVIRYGRFKIAACMFAGTDTLSSAFSGFVPVK